MKLLFDKYSSVFLVVSQLHFLKQANNNQTMFKIKYWCHNCLLRARWSWPCHNCLMRAGWLPPFLGWICLFKTRALYKDKVKCSNKKKKLKLLNFFFATILVYGQKYNVWKLKADLVCNVVAPSLLIPGMFMCCDENILNHYNECYYSFWTGKSWCCFMF